MGRNKREAVSYELRATRDKIQDTKDKLQGARDKGQDIRSKGEGVSYGEQVMRSKLQTFGFSLLLVLISVCSFAQQGNRAVQEGNDAYKSGDYKTAVKDYSKATETDKK